VKSILLSKDFLLPQYNDVCEYPLYQLKNSNERVLMRSYPAYILNLNSSHFDSVIDSLSNNKQMTSEKLDDVKFLFKKFRKEEVCISEKSDFGLPLPVLVNKRNPNMILSK
jgi:hypothetical protein